jgi:glycosyltransferase involved in cell wall biosynthesis
MTLDSKQIQNCPPVSVIILTYNGSKFIKPLLDSLLNQSYPQDRMEILVVDNASSDETISIIRQSHPSIKIVALEENIGYAFVILVFCNPW